MDRQTVLGRLQGVLATGLETTLETVIGSTSTQVPIDDPAKRKLAMDALITSASRRVATLSACNSMSPGWLDMLNLAPSLINVTREQLCLVRDVAQLSGVGAASSACTVMAVMVKGLGKPAASALPARQQVLQWEAVSPKTLSLQLAGCVAQQAAGAAVSRWLPCVGPAALGVWSGYTTSRIGRSSSLFFDHLRSEGFTAAGNTAASSAHAVPAARHDAPSDTAASLLEMCKLQALIGLARVDGRVCDSERQFIAQALADPRLSDTQRARLHDQLDGGPAPLDDLDILARHPDAAVGLLSNLVVLALRDGELHSSEKLYVRHLGKRLGFDRADVDELLMQASQQPIGVTP